MDMSTEKQLDMLEDEQIPAEEPVLEASEPEIELAAPEEEPKDEVPLEIGLEELKAQLKRAEEARIDAERRAQEAMERANQHAGDNRETQLQLLSTAIEDLKRHQAVLRQQKVEALAMGDYEKVADLDEQIFEAKNNAKIIESHKAEMEAQPVQRYQAPPVDPVEATISQLKANNAYRSADWIREHPEYVTDTRKYHQMIKAHEFVVAQGVTPETDEYFDRVESLLGLQRGQDTSSPMSSAAAPVARRSAPVAAPVSRGSSGMSKNAYRLTAAEKEAAAISGLTEEEYAAQKVRANGRMN